MSRLSIFLFIISFCLLSGINSDAFANSKRLIKSPFVSGETLHYKLSYRGLLTTMIWADLADIKMTYYGIIKDGIIKNGSMKDSKTTPDEQTAVQYELSLSTENYSKAEIFQPVRYTYTSTLDASLQRTLLVEEVDNGKNQSHDFLWLDWQNKETQLFKKREKEQHTDGFLGMNSKVVWEPDGDQAIPDFLGDYPLLENSQTYLIHKESGDRIKYSQILDPLSLIYTLRTFDFSPDLPAIREIAVAVSDDIRLYRVKKLALEKLSINGKLHEGTKIKIQTDEKKDNHYYVWLSNDQEKIPLRLSMDAPLGKLEIDLMKVTQQQKN